MLTKRTIIGTIVGGAITAIGVAALVLAIGLQTIQVNDTFDIGSGTTYALTGPEGADQFLKITGDSFDVTLDSPENSFQVPLTSFKKEKSFSWVHSTEGKSVIKIQNTGQSELLVEGTVHVSSDTILFTYHFLVITAGLVIVGFSAGFSTRRPRGF